MTGGAGSVTYKRREPTHRRLYTTQADSYEFSGIDLNDTGFFEKIRQKINDDAIELEAKIPVQV